MKKTILALAVAALVSTSPALAQEFTPYAQMPAGVYSLDKNHASLVWKVSHAGLSNYTARFKSFDADITFDPADVTKSSVKAVIDPLSLETDYVATAEKDFNKNLSTQEQWLNAGTFPQITFTSTSIEKTGDNTGRIHGNLTMLGVSKPVTLDTVFNGAYIDQPFSGKPTIGFSATGQMKRSDWGFDTYIPTIGDNVTFMIEAEFVKKD